MLLTLLACTPYDGPLLTSVGVELAASLADIQDVEQRHHIIAVAVSIQNPSPDPVMVYASNELPPDYSELDLYTSIGVYSEHEEEVLIEGGGEAEFSALVAFSWVYEDLAVGVYERTLHFSGWSCEKEPCPQPSPSDWAEPLFTITLTE